MLGPGKGAAMIRRLPLLVALVFFLLAWTPCANAAMVAYLFLEGSNQGQIPGEIEEQHYEEHIAIYDFHHLILRDDSGHVSHEELIFTMRMGKASTKIFQSLDTGEAMIGHFKFMRLDGTGQLEHYYSISLENGRITAVEPITPNVLDPEHETFPNMVRVRMIYQRIVLTYEPDNIEVQLEVGGSP